MSIETIRTFAISKLDWIKQQQAKVREQERETPREYVDRESHYVWGKRYLLLIVEKDVPPEVRLTHNTMALYVRPGSDEIKRREVVNEWYRTALKSAVPPLIKKWEPILGVQVDRFFVQRMKTKWGGCNVAARTIRLNTDLAKKPPECLEYIVVHEMVHLLEASHGERFRALMDRFMPAWQHHRAQLNQLPLRHESWTDTTARSVDQLWINEVDG